MGVGPRFAPRLAVVCRLNTFSSPQRAVWREGEERCLLTPRDHWPPALERELHRRGAHTRPATRAERFGSGFSAQRSTRSGLSAGTVYNKQAEAAPSRSPGSVLGAILCYPYRDSGRLVVAAVSPRVLAGRGLRHPLRSSPVLRCYINESRTVHYSRSACKVLDARRHTSRQPTYT